jgi:hypothetical protein
MPTEQIPTPRPKRTTTKTASKTTAPTTAGTTAAPAATPAKPTTAKSNADKALSAKPAASRPKATKIAKPARPSDIAAPMIDPEYRRALIAEGAYLRAERRHFAPGYEVEDWLNAESEIDTRLTLGVVSPTK